MAETMSDEAGGLGPARQPPKAAQMACVVSIALINSLGSVGGAAGPVAMGMRKKLVDIQYGRAADPHGWIRKVL